MLRNNCAIEKDINKDDFINNDITNDIIVKGRWKLGEKIGQGAFGVVYSAFDVETNQYVAIKFESITARKQVLKLEVLILKSLQESQHACEYKGCGKIKIKLPHIAETKEYNFMVIQLLGSNLVELRKKQPGSKFSVGTTALLVHQMISALNDIHDCGYIHRDVKPSNFALKLTSERPNVVLIDYGLARRFLNANTNGKIREPRAQAGFRGTTRYASINAHNQKELSAADDLMSLFYVMIEFLTGQLPWKSEKDKIKVKRLKEKYGGDVLCDKLPVECLHFYNHVQKLGYFDRPDYSYLGNLMLKMLQNTGLPDSIGYDWEIDKDDDNVSDKVDSINPFETTSNKRQKNNTKELSPTPPPLEDYQTRKVFTRRLSRIITPSFE